MVPVNYYMDEKLQLHKSHYYQYYCLKRSCNQHNDKNKITSNIRRISQLLVDKRTLTC